MAPTERTSAANLPAPVRRRSQRLVELYEAEAYRIYNLALRITCDRSAAARTTETAFLRWIATESDEPKDSKDALVGLTVNAALIEAKRGIARPPRAKKGKRRTAEERLLAAVFALPPAERAAIALLSVGERSPSAVASATGTTTESASALLKRARRSMGQELRVAPSRLGPKLRDWPWAEPPTEIWESVYPKAHKLLAEREEAALEGDESSAPPKERKKRVRLSRRMPRGVRNSAPAKRRKPRSRTTPLTDLLSGRSGVWAFRALLLAIVLTPATVVALIGAGDHGRDQVALSATGGSTGAAAGTSASATSQGGSTYEALTPKELDQLRMRELDQLRQYTQEQADQTLSASERSQATQKAEQLLALARQRLDEAEQHEQQAAAKQKKPPPSATPAPATQPVTGVRKKKRRKQQPAPTTTTPSDSISNCLYNPDTGTYVCPQTP